MRRRFMPLAASAALLSAAMLSASCAASPPPAPAPDAGRWPGGETVRVESGLLRGAADRGGTYSWKGIPYAQPPVGALRWAPPQKPLPWQGTREARRFGPEAPQFGGLGRGLEGSEDCLALNVWRPASGAEGLPVYVWIHGGGNTTGYSAESDYQGWALASRQNLVFVSIDYRLGPLGWFAAPGSGAEADEVSPNFGSEDILAALEWVRDNIRSFGGDPGRVTVAGESAGAANIMSLLTARRASGLFQRAVIESGYPALGSMEEARAASLRLLEGLLLKERKAKDAASARALASAMTREEALAFLRSLSAGKILSLLKPAASGMTEWPTVYADGLLFPSDGFACLDRGDYPVKVPLILGSNREEMKVFLFLEGKLKPSSPLYRGLATWGSLDWKASSVDAFATKLASAPGQPPVYAYRFDWGSPDSTGKSEQPWGWGERLGACHAMEIPFFLGTPTIFGSLLTPFIFTRGNEAGRIALTETIGAYLGAFAATGDPNAADPADPPLVADDPPALPTASHARPRWEPWKIAPGSPDLLVLDARDGRASVGLSSERLSVEGVRAAMEAALDPATLAAVRGMMFKWKW